MSRRQLINGGSDTTRRIAWAVFLTHPVRSMAGRF